VQKIVKSVPTPNGVKAYVTGPAALSADQHMAGDRSVQVNHVVHVHRDHRNAVVVYRSIITLLLTLVMVVVRTIVPRAGWSRSWVTTTSSGSRPSPPTCWSRWAIAAATDYAIF